MKRRRLTPNELQILDLICEGKNAAEIALLVHAAKPTIYARIERLKFEFECRSQAQLIAKLIKNNMLQDTNVHKESAGAEKQEANFAIRRELLIDMKRNINKILNTYQEHLL